MAGSPPHREKQGSDRAACLGPHPRVQTQCKRVFVAPEEGERRKCKVKGS